MTDEKAIAKYKKARTRRERTAIIAACAWTWGMFVDEVQDYLEREIKAASVGQAAAK